MFLQFCFFSFNFSFPDFRFQFEWNWGLYIRYFTRSVLVKRNNSEWSASLLLPATNVYKSIYKCFLEETLISVTSLFHSSQMFLLTGKVYVVQSSSASKPLLSESTFPIFDCLYHTQASHYNQAADIFQELKLFPSNLKKLYTRDFISIQSS